MRNVPMNLEQPNQMKKDRDMHKTNNAMDRYLVNANTISR